MLQPQRRENEKLFEGRIQYFLVFFAGLSLAISNILAGVARCLTIILIPFGIQHFKCIKLVFASAGKKVITKFSSHPVMNILWLISGGFLTLLLNILLGVVFACTLIGIPIAIQLFKLVAFQFAPFGAYIIRDGEYTRNKDTAYDFKLLQRKIHADPDVVIGTGEEGKALTATDYIRNRSQDLLLVENGIQQKSKSLLLVGILLGVFSFGLGLIYWLFIYPIVHSKQVKKPLLAYYRSNFLFLTAFYPNEAKTKKLENKGGFVAFFLASHALVKKTDGAGFSQSN